MRSRSNGGVIGAYALPTQNGANGVFFIHDAAIFNTGLTPIWPLAAGFITSATGGSITVAADNGNYKNHTFTANGTFTVTTGAALIDIFLVGGGGAGGVPVYGTSPTTTYYGAGGGGGGGSVMLVQSVWVKSGTTFTVTIGQAGNTFITNTSTVTTKLATETKVTSNQGHSYTAYGGGNGGYSGLTVGYVSPTAGGGGGGNAGTVAGAGASGLGVSATSSGGGTSTIYGVNSGGNAAAYQVTNGGYRHSGGGGGSGAMGVGYSADYSTDTSKQGWGADGYLYTRTGFYYGGGGGGGRITPWDPINISNEVGSTSSAFGGLGSSGGAGRANGGFLARNATTSNVVGDSSTDGFGGGGGGGAVINVNSFPATNKGGSGTVIFSYRYK